MYNIQELLQIENEEPLDVRIGWDVVSKCIECGTQLTEPKSLRETDEPINLLCEECKLDHK